MDLRPERFLRHEHGAVESARDENKCSHELTSIILDVLIAFDLDGTLIDSARDISESASELVQSYGAAPLPLSEVVMMVGEGASMLVRRAMEQASLDPATPDALERFLAIYDRRLLDHTLPYPGIPEVLSQLVERGPLAVLTNKPAAPSARLLEGLGLRGFFSQVVGGDGPYPRKPDPRGLLAMKAAAGDQQTVLIGDAPPDAKTAEAAGCAFVFARYGFGAGKFGNHPPRTPHVIDHPRELLRVLDAIDVRRASS
jgi:phosphoglycolate phosphatase